MKVLFRNWLTRIVKAVLTFSGRRFRLLILEAANDIHFVSESSATSHGFIKFYCINNLTRSRASSLLTKEPETIEWIDAFDFGDVFWDVGANVGAYSLYAAKAGYGPVYAFEPSAFNFSILNKNIELNGMSDRVVAYCLALSDKEEIGRLHMQSTDFGGALSSFGEPIDYRGQYFDASFSQGMIAYSIDELIDYFGLAVPNRLKIDVDGIEDRIVRGASRTLADKRLKSVSIELDETRSEYTDFVIKAIERGGLKLMAKRHAPRASSSEYKHIFNYQFYR